MQSKPTLSEVVIPQVPIVLVSVTWHLPADFVSLEWHVGSAVDAGYECLDVGVGLAGIASRVRVMSFRSSPPTGTVLLASRLPITATFQVQKRVELVLFLDVADKGLRAESYWRARGTGMCRGTSVDHVQPAHPGTLDHREALSEVAQVPPSRADRKSPPSHRCWRAASPCPCDGTGWSAPGCPAVADVGKDMVLHLRGGSDHHGWMGTNLDGQLCRCEFFSLVPGDLLADLGLDGSEIEEPSLQISGHPDRGPGHRIQDGSQTSGPSAAACRRHWPNGRSSCRPVLLGSGHGRACSRR